MDSVQQTEAQHGTEGASRPSARTSASVIGIRSTCDGVSAGTVAVCAAAVVGCSVYLLVTNASLVGDASYYLIRTVQYQPFHADGRQLTNLIQEGPLLLGVATGVRNTHSLTVLHGIGLLLFPAVVWTLAFFHARTSRLHFALVAISCGLCFATMIIYSVSALTLDLPLVVLVSVLLAQSDRWSGGRAVLVVLATGLTILSHEAIAPCAVVLALQAILRAKARLALMDARVSMVVAALSGIVVVVAVFTLVFWPNSNSASFLKHLETLTPLSMVTLIMGAAYILGWIVLYGHIEPGWLRFPLLVPATVFIVVGIQSAIQEGPTAAYSERGFCVIVVVMLQLSLLVDWIRPQWMERRNLVPLVSKGGVLSAVAFLLLVMVIPVVYAARWSSVVADVRFTITHHTGVVPATAVRTPLAWKYLWAWGWENPSLSVVLRSSSANAVVANRNPSVGPFAAHSAQNQIPPEYRWNG